MTASFSSGSTVFGDDQSDTHIFTGSVEITGSFLVNPHGANLISGSKLTIDADGGFSGSSDSVGSFGSINVAANTGLRVYASLIKGVTDACAVKDAKINGKLDVIHNNEAQTSST